MKRLIIICLSVLLCAFSCQTNKKATDAAAPDSPLCNTQWLLTNVETEPIEEAPEQPFIQFSEDGKFSGNLGCNQFFGSYTVQRDKIYLEYAGSTKKLCGNQTVEKAFTAALKKDINNYVIVGNVLIIRIKNQEILRFQAAPQIH